jgi:hypothetical protein
MPAPAPRMPDRPAAFFFVATPATGLPFGSHAAVAAEGQRLLAAELSHRLGRIGAAVAPLPFEAPPDAGSFHWGRWFVARVRQALGGGDTLDAVGFAGAGALALLDDAGLDGLLSPIPGEVVANNRFSADAFIVAGDLDRALTILEDVESDNGAPRALNVAGWEWRDLGAAPWARFDVDTTLDLSLLRLATRVDGTRALDGSVRGFLEMARLPGDRPLGVPHLERIGAVIRDRSAELVVAGRLPTTTWQLLETETACRVRGLVEERGMRSARAGHVPRSILAALLARSTPTELVMELARLGDAVVLDTRVLMAAVAGSADASTWPPEEERFASDFGDAARIATPWLRALVEAAEGASVPFLFGGHALVSDGLRLIVSAAWQGR